MYKLKCSNCGEVQNYYVGKVLNSGELEQKKCSKCGKQTITKTLEPIASAKFTNNSSRRSLKTRTGVGEVQFIPGAKKIIDKANE